MSLKKKKKPNTCGFGYIHFKFVVNISQPA